MAKMLSKGIKAVEMGGASSQQLKTVVEETLSKQWRDGQASVLQLQLMEAVWGQVPIQLEAMLTAACDILEEKENAALSEKASVKPNVDAK